MPARASTQPRAHAADAPATDDRPAAAASRPQRVHLETYGCTTNLGDTRTMAGILRAAGHTIVDDARDADVVVVNTCTVVDTTENRIAHRLGTLTAAGKRIIAAGCLAAARPDAVHAAAPGAALLTPRTMHQIDAVVSGRRGDDMGATPTPTPSRLPRTLGATDAIIQLSQGCLFTCAYCSTKHARGDQTSQPIDDLVADVRDAVNAGATLIQLTAQDTSGYGWDIDTDLPELVTRITAIGGDFRVRIGMMHPRTAHRTCAALLDAMDHPKVHKFLHLPIQSGSPRVLKAMNRGHDLDHFWSVVDAFRARFADGTISTDLIVGYPGETDDDHHASLALVDRLAAEHVNVTRFSARPGTPAKQLAGRVPTHVAKARSRELSARCLDVMAARNRARLGATIALTVVEPGKKDGSVLARGPGFEPVVIRRSSDEVPLGSRLTGRITETHPTYLVADPLDTPVPMGKGTTDRSLPVLPVIA